jgi:hypothetical protein
VVRHTTKPLYLLLSEGEDIMKKWTIMVYMCGDNNLSADMAYALQDIREVAKNTKGEINILAYYDGNLIDVPTYYFDFSNYKSEIQVASRDLENKLHPDNRGRQTVNENAAYANSVINFVDWCVNKVEYEEDGKTLNGRKAENYALIFSGHSFGFQDIGLFKDESAGYYMTHRKLSWVFEQLTKSKELLNKHETEILGKKLAILGFDSCVMSMLEVGYQFHEIAETIVASEGSVPNAGWTYGKLLGNICKQAESVDVRTVAKNLVRDFIEGESEYAIGGISVDMAAWDCSKVPEVADAFEKFVDNLSDCFKEEMSTICRQMRRILLQVHWNCQSYMYEQNVDLKDFCRLLYEEVESLENEFGHDFDGQTTKLKKTCFEVMKKLEECIILSGFCGGQYQFSNGMSIFFPWTIPGYKVSQKCYQNLAFHKTKAGEKWNQFLQFYLNVVTIRYPQNVAPDHKKEVERDNRSEIAAENPLSALTPPVIYEYRVKIPQNTTNKIPQNTVNKILVGADNDGDNAGSDDGELKIPQNTVNKLPWKPLQKIPQNTANKLPWNPSLKIPQNTVNKIPQNTVNKLFGGLDSFFHYFMSMKNIITPWNVFGFTKKVDLQKKGKPD